MKRKNAAAALCALLVTILVATTATAQNTVPRFSHGPTLPVFTVTWDDSGKAQSGMLNAGAGYALRLNFFRNWDERLSRMSLAIPFYVTLPEAGEFRYRTGLQLEALNGMLGFGGVVDMVNTGDGRQATGALVGDFSKANLALVFSFGINFGSGTPPPPTAVTSKAGEQTLAADRIADNRPPPGFVGW